MMQRSGIAAALSLSVFVAANALPAHAADMPGFRNATSWSAAPAATSHDWTGFYIGGNLGHGWATGTSELRSTWFPTLTASADYTGYLGGAQIGYNRQFGAVVAGVETDFQFSSLENDANGVLRSVPWFGTVRARLGLTVDRFLVYGTGGFAYGKYKVDMGGPIVLSTSTGWAGWTVGGGIEMALSRRWSAKFEYLHIRTGDVASLSIPGLGSLHEKGSSHIGRVGVNLRW